MSVSAERHSMPDTAPYMRPAGWVRAIDGHLPCRERYALNQSTPAGLPPSQKLCIRCGRVTARRDEQGMPWCGGNPPEIKEHQPT